jgi:signal transduction histidine kinase
MAARLLMFFCVSAALQNLGDAYNFQYSVLPWRWLFWLHLALEHATYALAFATICHFFLVFPAPHPLLNRFPRLALLTLYASILLVVLVAMALAPTWSVALERGNRISLIVSAVQVVLVLCIIIRSIFVARDAVARAQIRWLIWSTGIFFVGMVFGYLLPLVLTGRSLVPHPVAMFLIIILPLSYAVAILRYRLFDIDVIINRSLVYGTLTAFLAGFYLLLVRLLTLGVQAVAPAGNETLVIFIATLTIALAAAPLRRRVQALIDRAFFRTKLDYRRFLPEMSAQLATNIVLERLVPLLTKELPHRLQIDGASLLVLDSEGQRLDFPAGEGDSLPVTHPLVVYLARSGRPLLCSPTKQSLPGKACAFLWEHGAELSIPLIVGERLVGVYNLGPKLSGVPYTREEIHLLTILGQQASVSVENARLYREVESYTRTLEEQVHQRTHELEEAYRDMAGQHETLDGILRSIADGLIVTGAEGRILLVNPACARFLARPVEELTGQRLQDILPDPALQEMVAAGLAEPDAVSIANVVLPAGRVLRASVGLLGGAGERAGGAVTVLRDVTHEVEVDRMKTEFTSMVSHELRTPLTSVMGFAKLIRKEFERHIVSHLVSDDRKVERARERIRENLGIIVSEGERLTRLINDILDISKMEAGKMAWEFGSVKVGEVIEQAVAATRALAQEKELEVAIKVGDGLPVLYADRDRLVQVVTNLLSNSIKFTDAGRVRVQAWRLEVGDDIAPFGVRQPDVDVGLPAAAQFVAVSVSDTGVGVAEADLEKVFIKFRQVGDRASGTLRGGTGLGLPICKEIVEHHEGRIWVESRLGEGSRFVFTLPLSREHV